MTPVRSTVIMQVRGIPLQLPVRLSVLLSTTTPPSTFRCGTHVQVFAAAAKVKVLTPSVNVTVSPCTMLLGEAVSVSLSDAGLIVTV